MPTMFVKYFKSRQSLQLSCSTFNWTFYVEQISFTAFTYILKTNFGKPITCQFAKNAQFKSPIEQFYLNSLLGNIYVDAPVSDYPSLSVSVYCAKEIELEFSLHFA